MNKGNLSSEPTTETKVSDKRKLPSSILFLCTQNAVRSPMAAALLKQLVTKKTFIQSAGIDPKEVNGFAITVLKEVKVDISDHVSLAVEAVALSSFDLVICFSKLAKQHAENICNTVATEFEFWPVYDPVNQAEKREEQLEHYRKLRVQLEELLEANFEIN